MLLCLLLNICWDTLPSSSWATPSTIRGVCGTDGCDECVCWGRQNISWFHVTSSDIGHLMITNRQGSQGISHDLVGFSVGSFHLLATHTHTHTDLLHTHMQAHKTQTLKKKKKLGHQKSRRLWATIFLHNQERNWAREKGRERECCN